MFFFKHELDMTFSKLSGSSQCRWTRAKMESESSIAKMEGTTKYMEVFVGDPTDSPENVKTWTGRGPCHIF